LIKIKNVFYAVSDVKKTSEFYQNILGLQLQFIDENQWAQFKVNGLTFALGGPDEVPNEIKTGAVVTFEVDDLSEVKDELERTGLKVSEIREMGSHGKTCWFLDPAENIVQLYQVSSV
jgi:predicted enzyme related to lactoylglutathione lyase